ncbi:acylphosphatase [Oceanobacillus longus]|uniref:Acylphosphatase n=1 Tax=Oceanobacillus longus TaxID=930120 RepID=A0ABV8H2G0_9BACI
MKIMTHNREWLPHIENSIPEEARGYSVSMYSIALEGWRRGLTLKFINKNRRKSELYYSLSNQEKEHIFTVSRGDKISQEAMRICKNKHLTKEYLIKAGVPTPEGELFEKNVTADEMLNYAKKLGYPVVVKPLDGTGGTGVIANIRSDKEFKEALSFVRDDLKFTKVIVEKHYEGRGYRVFAIGDKVVGAFDRIPANVIGDGKNTVRELLRLKLVERDKNPALFKRPIKEDKEMYGLLRQKGYTMDSVPKTGERVFLKTSNNVSSGGDSIDVTDKITDEVKDIAVRALKAIPNLAHAGIDFMVDEENNTSVILEINTTASIRNHLFPNEGIARDIPKAIIDYYFPETKNYQYDPNTLYYFDFGRVFELFSSGYAKEVVVPEHPKGEGEAVRFEVSGENLNNGYFRWIRQRALKLRLNGYVKKMKNGNALIVISGNTDNVNLFRMVIKKEMPSTTTISNVVEKERKTPVKVGFEVQTTNSSSSVPNKATKPDGYAPVYLENYPGKKSSSTRKRRTTGTSTLRKERDLYRKKYNDMINSRSWKITKPIRKIGSLIKNSKNN